jgi:hypothetical protein
MTYVPIIPHVPVGSGGSDGGPRGKPPWLKLEEGEVFVRAYGAAAGGGKRPIVAVAIGLVVMAGMGLFNLCRFAKPEALKAVSQSDNSVPWIAIAVAIILVVNIGFVVAIKAAKQRKAEAYLTSKMLIVKSGKEFAGVPLADISAVQLGTGAARNTLIVHARTAQGPVAQLPVENPDAGLTELIAYSKAAGANLK